MHSFTRKNVWVRQVEVRAAVTHPLIVLGVVNANATFPNDSAHTHIQDE